MNIGQSLLNGLKPIPITLVSDWANANRYLTSESAAEPGRYSTSRTPYIVEIIDFLSANSPGTTVDIMKGHQLGLTEAALCLLGYYIDVSPCPTMYLLPTLDNAKDFADTRFTTMVNASPALSLKIRPARERDSGNTKLMKTFSGGFTKFPGANSAASLASKAIRVLIEDETDRYPSDADGEGQPHKIAEKRQSTFGLKKKTMRISTPGNEHTSVIEPEYLKGDQRKYHVPCPHCGSYQELKFEQLAFDENDLSKGVFYQCIESECKAQIEERYKTKMLASGKWVPSCPEKQSVFRRSYHINSLYSPIGWLSWSEIVREYLDSKDDPAKFKVFVNTILGETWKETGEVPEWENVYHRSGEVEPNKISNDIYFITCGVDTQGDRLEAHFIGWGKNKIKQSIDYRVFLGSPGTDRPWNELAKTLDERWVRPDGVEIPVKLMAIDTGGHHSSEVYAFCRKYDSTRVIPVKGSNNFNALTVTSPKPVDTTKSGKKIGKMKVWVVGVSSVKSEIYNWLKLSKTTDVVPPGYFFIPKYPETFFRGITAEQLQTKTDKKGFRVYEWVKKYRENEPLDTTVYARAAAAVIGIDRMNDFHFDEVIRGYNKSKPLDQPPRRKSNFW